MTGTPIGSKIGANLGTTTAAAVDSAPGMIAVGDILIERGTYLPDSLTPPGESSQSGWSAVKSDRPTYDREIKDAGWTNFFMAGEIKATVFGSDKQKALRTALKRLIEQVKSQRCNSIEITDVTAKSFLMVPYVRVSAHARHLQQGMVFSGHR
jgi:hypothetical protein